MKTIPIFKLLKDKKFLNKNISISGWVRNKRKSKYGLCFIDVYDGSCFDSIQVLAKKELINYKKDILKLSTGCSVVIYGILKESIHNKQSVEFLAKKISVFGFVDNPRTYPISPKYHTLEYLRKIPHLRPRTNLIGAVARIRNTVFQSIHEFFNKNNYLWIATPIITKYNTEESSKMFYVSTLDYLNNFKFKKRNYKEDFFGCEAYLTVSGQLNGEAYACSLSRIYTFGPIFRAENSNTQHHLAEFWMVEPEVAFFDLDDIIILASKLLKYIFQSVLEKRIDDLDFFKKKIDDNILVRLESFLKSDLIKITYDQAVEILKKVKNFFKNKDIFWGMDFFSEHERYLTEIYFKKPVVVINYPKDIKSFYMRLNNDNKTVASMDILMPYVGEIIGGSEREERFNVLVDRIKKNKLNKKDYSWYIDLRKYGTVPHAGFGLGFERLICYITGLKNIRDSIPFPRTPNNINC